MLRVNKILQGCPFKHCFSDLEAETLLVEGRAQAWGIGESSWEPYTGRMAALGNHKQLRTALEGEFPTMRLKGGLPPPRRKGDIFFPPRKTPHPGIPPHLFPTLLLCPPRSNSHTVSFSPFLFMFLLMYNRTYSGSAQFGSFLHMDLPSLVGLPWWLRR